MASIFELRKYTSTLDKRLDLARLFDELQRQARTRMERDMAVKEPSTRVVDLERNHCPSADIDVDNVSPSWIFEVEHGVLRYLTFSLGENVEVMAVQMHRMNRRRQITWNVFRSKRIVGCDDKVYPLVRLVVQNEWNRFRR